MIALLLGLLAAIAPDSTSTEESTTMPVHVSAFLGPSLSRIHDGTCWWELAGQLEFTDVAIFRYGFGIPMFDQGFSTKVEAYNLERSMQTLSLGKEWRRGRRWATVGAGWSWLEFDTTGTQIDSRTVFYQNNNGLYSRHTSYSSSMSDQITWVYPVVVNRQGPYLFAEAGGGWAAIAFGVRAEYRFGPAIGTFVRLRIPWWSPSTGETDD